MSTISPAVTPPVTARPPKPAPPRPPVLQARERPRTNWRVVILVNLVSMLLHGAFLGACAFIVFDRETFEEIFTTLAVTEETEDVPIVEQAPVQPDELTKSVDSPVLTSNVSELITDTKALADLDIDDLEPSVMPEDFDVAGPNIKIGDHFSGRTSAAKAALVKQFGGNSASEAAVASGLRWLASRQLKDGSWSFDHTRCQACKEADCTQPGTLSEAYTGATAFALLAFLGGGHTHKKGDYQRVVKDGLDSLLRNSLMTDSGLDLCPKVYANEKMYVQGLGTIALCETASLTKDPRYAKPAYQALKFVIAAQDPNGGGWRYVVRQPGDTSVVGWQIMALKSGQNSKLKVPSGVFKLADKYLDSVQAEKGATYGYEKAPTSYADSPPTTTAVGLLCRMYLGWDKKTPALQAGVEYLDKVKPSPNNMYYNYYATQVLHHWGGDEWKRWNDVMRDQLIRTQVKEGPEAGSWNLTDPHGGGGGRLYQTCLCVMTLEVYYRHLPIYQREKLKVEY